MKIADIDGDGDLDAVARIDDDTEIGGKVVWFRNPRPARPLTVYGRCLTSAPTST
ncbi:MAG: hypothetical protein M5U19_16465 [Microthrixaceae bacterium]|nr:hypothetical protein [Microthrixaceae bacterium]